MPKWRKKSFKQLFGASRKRPGYWLAILELEIRERVYGSRILTPHRNHLSRLVAKAVEQVLDENSKEDR